MANGHGGARRGAGRKTLAREIEYLKFAKDAVTPVQFGRLCKAMVREVIVGGNARAFGELRKVFVAEVTRQETGEIGEYERYLQSLIEVARKPKARRKHGGRKDAEPQRD